MSRRRLVAAVLALAAGSSLAAEPAPTVAVDGTRFVVTMPDGRRLASEALVGAVLRLRAPNGGKLALRIDAVRQDPLDATGAVLLHELSVDAGDGTWQPVCEPDPEGLRWGFPLADASGGIEVTCTAGAVGKCVRAGYHPWRDAGDGAPLAELHAACVRMIRADYCGGPTTRDGVLIDMFDDLGVQAAENLPDHDFEAGWTAEGAVCVHHPRVPANVTLDTLAASCPRLAGRLGATCSEARARELGARLFNNSSP